MPNTRHVLIGDTLVTLYSLNGRDWFSSPISLLKTRERLNAEGAELRESWKHDRLIEDIFPAPGESWVVGLGR